MVQENNGVWIVWGVQKWGENRLGKTKDWSVECCGKIFERPSIKT
jgi:hypothetical protein